MTEAMYYLMLCFLEEKENGTLHKDWLDVVVAFCDKMIEIQNTDGSWYRAYTMEGTPMTYPEEWFGSNVIEQGSGTIFPGEVLALVHEYTGNEKYRSALCKAADFIMEHYVEDVLYLGGLNDTTHKKSVKIDAVGVMYNMRTLLLAYETTKKNDICMAQNQQHRFLHHGLIFGIFRLMKIHFLERMILEQLAGQGVMLFGMQLCGR